jgi:succinyl-CoA synthetase alpha subunit
MTILVGNDTKVVVQGATGREGRLHTAAMLRYGTKILAGVTPGRGGEIIENTVPVFNTVKQAVEKFPQLNSSIIFVPAPFASDAVYESIDSGLKLIVVITEHVPIHDSIRFTNYAYSKGVTIIGPNCPGIISPGLSKIGIMPGHIFSKGQVGMVSRSGTLTYEIAWILTRAGYGQSTAVGIGGDPIIGKDLLEIVEMFAEDGGTTSIVVIGEIGGDAEERLAGKIKHGNFKKPVVAFIAGRKAPPGKRMGHAGAIISMGTGTAASKIEAFKSAGVPVAELPSQIPELLQREFEEKKKENGP